MEELLLDIIETLRKNPDLDARGLTHLINMHSNRLPGDKRFAKKQLMPYYINAKANNPELWQSWRIDAETERALLRLIQMKPRRTASGVATITVITKPWQCRGNCLFYPADVRMPKSYLHAEPACQRAERNWFDPYLQVAARLRALTQMGHATDKVELIVLGGTFDDYPQPYRIWFVKELFRALNEADKQDHASLHADAFDARLEHPDRFSTHPSDPSADGIAMRCTRYRDAGIPDSEESISQQTRALQSAVTAGSLLFNEAIAQLYQAGPWSAVATWQQARIEELLQQQHVNETATHRCVGLVVETRPDRTTPANLALLRQLGCTKVQVGVQTLKPDVITFNRRHVQPAAIQRTFELLRLFGFKIHAHFMVNLPGTTPTDDIDDYRNFVANPAFQPDEVKLYPCALIDSAPLARELENNAADSTGAKPIWEPYDEDTLVGVLAADVLATPAFTRISRMIRDFSAGDIVAGNKKTNLRQMVEERLRESAEPVREIRFREIGTDTIDADSLQLQELPYGTTATDERFLQWVAPDGRIAGFLRLSLPHPDAVASLGEHAPVSPREAMIREVHVYGRVARLNATSGGAQHLGLGRQLIERAEAIARAAGYTRINVISAIGTREYYRKLGFRDHGLYQQKDLPSAHDCSDQAE